MAIIRYRNADGTIKEVVCLKGDKGDKGDAGGTAAETTVENGNDIRIPHGGGQSAPLGDNVQNALENLADAFNGTYIYTDTKTEDAMQFARNTFCNALKGKAEGELVTLRDVSPVRHNVGVEVSGKNLANKAAFVEYPSVRKYLDVYLPAGNYYYSSNMHAASGAVFYTGIVPDGEIINNNNIQLFSNFNGTVDEGAFTIAESGTYRFLIYCSDANIKAALDGAWDNVWIQIERGVKATPYTPYIEDASAVKVQVVGKNLFDPDVFLDVGFEKLEDGTLYFGNPALVSGKTVFKAKGNVGQVTLSYKVKTLNATGSSGVRFLAYYTNGQKEYIGNVLSADDYTTVTYTSLTPIDGSRQFDRLEADYGSSFNPTWIRDIQVEFGTTATVYEPYRVAEYTQYEAIPSVSPSMTVTTDTEGAMVTVDYNRDINKAFEALMQMVATTGGNV